MALLAGFMVRTIRKWQCQGKVPPAPADGLYDREYVQILQTYRKNALSTQSKNRWGKLMPEERTAVAQKQWTPERKTEQSSTMKKVRAGLTGLTPQELEDWNTNAQNAANTPEVRQAKSNGAQDLWKKRNAQLAEAERILENNRAKPQPPKSIGGRPEGMSAIRQEEARRLERYIADFELQHGTKRGAMPYACQKVYPNVPLHKAVERGRKTIQEHKAFLGTKPPHRFSS